MNFDMTKYTKSKWLKGSDLPMGKATAVTIKHVYEHEFEQTKETKPVVDFLEIDQHLPLNKAQVTALLNLFGTDARSWANQRINLMPVPSSYQGKPTILITAGEPPQPTWGGSPAPQPNNQPPVTFNDQAVY